MHDADHVAGVVDIAVHRPLFAVDGGRQTDGGLSGAVFVHTGHGIAFPSLLPGAEQLLPGLAQDQPRVDVIFTAGFDELPIAVERGEGGRRRGLRRTRLRRGRRFGLPAAAGRRSGWCRACRRRRGYGCRRQRRGSDGGVGIAAGAGGVAAGPAEAVGATGGGAAKFVGTGRGGAVCAVTGSAAPSTAATASPANKDCSNYLYSRLRRAECVAPPKRLATPRRRRAPLA